VGMLALQHFSRSAFQEGMFTRATARKKRLVS
jgi:hypothetical protein